MYCIELLLYHILFYLIIFDLCVDWRVKLSALSMHCLSVPIKNFFPQKILILVQADLDDVFLKYFPLRIP